MRGQVVTLLQRLIAKDRINNDLEALSNRKIVNRKIVNQKDECKLFSCSDEHKAGRRRG